LGGAVVGAISDVSASFYNPGGLILADSLDFSFSISVLERRSLELDRGLAGPADLANERIGIVPSLVGGAIWSAESGRHVVAYSVIMRDRTRSSASRLVESVPAGFDLIGTHLSFLRESTERWGGVSWAYRPAPHVGLGATGYIANRSDRRELRVVLAGTQDGAGLVSTRRRDFDYQQISAIGKFGLLVDYPSAGLGVTVTTASRRLSGSE